MSEPPASELLSIVADIVSAFVSNNQVRATELPDLIAAVHGSLSGIDARKVTEEPVAVPLPAVSIKKSITDDYLICLDDGKKFKSLRRHLATLGMTPEDYRAKWGLSRDYPMVAPGYAAKRSALAKASGLGIGRRRADPPIVPESVPTNDAGDVSARRAAAKRTDATDEAAPPPAKRRGRPKKVA